MRHESGPPRTAKCSRQKRLPTPFLVLDSSPYGGRAAADLQFYAERTIGSRKSRVAEATDYQHYVRSNSKGSSARSQSFIIEKVECPIFLSRQLKLVSERLGHKRIEIMSKPWTWQEGQLFDRTIEIWLELHYEPDPGNPETSFVVAYLSRPTGTVFTVQLEPGNLPDGIDRGPIMIRVLQEVDSLISHFDMPIGPMPSGPSIAAIGERSSRRPTTNRIGMLWWKEGGHRPGRAS